MSQVKLFTEKGLPFQAAHFGEHKKQKELPLILTLGQNT